MKLIITGACGHIGSYIAENIYKVKKIKKTILIDNLKSNRFCSIFDQNIKNKLEFHLGDLTNEKSLDKFKKVDYLIHCASMTNAEKSFGKEGEGRRTAMECKEMAQQERSEVAMVRRH